MKIIEFIKIFVKWFYSLFLIMFCIYLACAIIFYNEHDVSFNTTTNISNVVHNKTGKIGAYLSDLFIQSLAGVSFLIILLLLKISYNIIFNKFKRYNNFYKFIMFLLFILSSSAFVSYFFGDINYWGNKSWGGFVGFYIVNSMVYLPDGLSLAIILFSLLFSLTILLDLSFRIWKIYLLRTKKLLLSIIYWIFLFFGKKLRFFNKKNKKENSSIDVYKNMWEQQNGKIINLEKSIREILQKEKNNINNGGISSNVNDKINDLINNTMVNEINEDDFIDNEDEIENIETAKQIKKETSSVLFGGAKKIINKVQKYVLPTIELLSRHIKEQNVIITREDLFEQANNLKKVLADFKIAGKVISVKAGPIITLYEFEPSAGTKSSRIIGLADDIARNLKVRSARISVIENKNAMGIEIPNKIRDTIYLKEVLESQEFQKTKFALPIILGTNISGEPVIIDLAKAPHLLIAGTTGSGKSVSINTMILSLLYKYSPEECKFIMIDPKMLELSVYEGIPHLLTPVVTEPQKAILSLKWVVNEMEERYKVMSNLGVRHINGYNERLKKAEEEGKPLIIKVLVGYDHNGEPLYDSREIETKSMPYIVVVVDEMADLMITAGKDIEALIQRLAQMARAAGIHIVMATQRPSVDVITGVIKANFPSRISFLVSSKIDSKVIIGDQGAEQLLGMGDMLYMPNGGKLTRAHGPFVSDQEVENIVSFICRQGFKPSYVKEIIDNNNNSEEGSDENFDINIDSRGESDETLYRQAVQIVKRDRKTSISYIQRMLRIGYNKAATIIDRMEKEGILSSPNSMGKREIID